MRWVNEIESTKSVADLKKSYSIAEARLQTNFEVLDSEIASGLKKVINGDFKRRAFSYEEAAQKEERFLTGRQVASMIFEYFQVSDTDESVLDFSEIFKVEWKNDNVQSSNMGWDETILAMKKQPDDEVLEN